ncbi:MAG: EAL domain-containing protein [Betaproteobacteria bacterium]|nr:EAL domain-containing protein [Betaproteobacteria bacterium]
MEFTYSPRTARITAVVWTLAVGGSLAWNMHHESEQVMAMAYAEARANYNKDITFRRWSNSHGGVYVPITATQQSVPWLAHVPGRDVKTADGRDLTLLNPASMLRQMMDRYAIEYGVLGRITGLKQLNPGNAPDAWERAQLEAFTRGERQEAWAIADLGGKPHLRYLHAMYMEPGCDKCHAILGYKTGDMRGATGVNLPLAAYLAQEAEVRALLGLTHGGIWLLGMFGIGWSAHQQSRRGVERQAFLNLLRTEKERAEVTLASIGDAVVTTDAEGRIEFMNPVAERLTGWTTLEAHGLPVETVVVMVNEETRAPAPNPVHRCRLHGEIVGLANHTALISRNGSEISIEDSAAPIHDPEGNVAGVVMVFHDVSEARGMARQMTWQVTHDGLTGLTSRGEFERRLSLLVEDAHLYGSQHVLIYLDLDNFKVVNDTCGHLAGDELLRQLAFLLSEQMRKNDTLARLGGDEFGVLLEQCPLPKAQAIAEKLRHTVSQFRFAWNGRSFEVGASFGLAVVGQETASPAEAMSAADVACYAAKDGGRNRVHVYSLSDNESAARHREMHLVADIREAITAGHFVLHAQEVLMLRAYGARRFEVLVRMLDRHDGQTLLPGGFIPVAERYGLMPEIDRWVVERSVRWLGVSGAPDVQISINLSALSFRDDRIVDALRAALQESGVAPGRLTFEVTETAAMAHLAESVRIIRELREMGCRIALDDFGSGMSSFAYLKNLPVDELKIDGAFVRDMLNDPADRAFVVAINQVAHSLGKETVAEFAETQALVDALRAIGVDAVQGYAIARPRPLSEIL